MKKEPSIILVLLTGLALTLGLAACPTEPDSGHKEKVAMPTALPQAGEYPAGTSIILVSETEGATIYYTLDGSAPSRSSILYSETSKPEIPAGGCTLKAFAFKTGMTDSAVLTVFYTTSISGQVSAPTASPQAGSVAAGTEITLACTTAGASIYYTLNGNTPDSSSTLYSDGSKPTISAACTLKAIALKEGMTGSEVLTADYTINANKVAAPTASPQAGSVAADTEITLASTTAGASIYYTLNGNTPDNSSPLYSDGAKPTISAACTLKAIAFKEGMEDSDILSAAYTIAVISKVETPTANPQAGSVAAGTEITLASTTAGASIYYTLNGNTPDSSSTLYSEGTKPTITAACTLKAIALKEGMTDSDLLTAAYTISVNGQAAAPTANPAAGSVTVGTEITLTSITAGASIYYTLDGNTPTSASTLYSDGSKPTVPAGGCTLKAIAVKADMAGSTVLTAVYTIVKAATPTATPVTGATVSPNQPITLNCATVDAVIHYTLDGTPPTGASPQYNESNKPQITAGNTTLKAIAVKTGMASSDVLEAEYTINALKAAAPTASPAAGSVTIGTEITLASATEGASIYYTLDGNTPTSSSTQYTAGSKPTISAACTLKAIAIKGSMDDSDILEAAYTIVKAAAPTASPAAGSVTIGTEITLASATEGASIYYTLDGNTPTSSSVLYGDGSKPAIPAGGCTLKAIAIKGGMEDSDVLEAAYTITKVAAPLPGSAAGQVPLNRKITLTSTTEGASIYYTLDSSAPTTSSTLYSDSSKPVIAADCTLKAIAVKTGMAGSDLLEAAYTVYIVPLDFSFIGKGTEDGKSKLTFDSASLLARKVAYGNGVWVVVGDCTVGTENPGQIVYSEDNGDTWNTATTNSSTTHLFNVTFCGDKFFAAGRQGGRHYSANGKEWTAATGNAFANIYGLAYSGSRLVLTDDSRRIGYSDTITTSWTRVDAGTEANQSQFGSGQIQGAAYGNNTFVVGGTAGKIAYSTDNGVTWLPVEPGTESGQSQIDDAGATITYITYGGRPGSEKFIAVSTRGYLVSSSDGVNWTAISTTGLTDITTSFNFRFVTWGGGRFLAGGGTTSSVGMMFESPDGVTWTKVTLPTTLTTKAYYGAAYGNGKFIAVDSQGILAVSNDLE
jgi:hypothetical protein